MFNSTALEVVIGLVFIYLLYSLLATTINEAIASLLGLRAKMLEKAITRMLDDGVMRHYSIWNYFGDTFRSAWKSLKAFLAFFSFRTRATPRNKMSLLESFYNHPGIKYLGENKIANKPAYISADFFSKALIDTLKAKAEKPGATPLVQIQDGIASLTNTNETKQLIQSLMDDAENDIEKFRTLIEHWYNETMHRTTGWYKRQSQKITFVIGFVIAVAFNVDSITIVKKLSSDKDAAKALSDIAGKYVETHRDSSGKLDTIEEKVVDSLFLLAKKQVDQDIHTANSLIGLGWYIPHKVNSPFKGKKNALNTKSDAEQCEACFHYVRNSKWYVDTIDKGTVAINDTISGKQVMLRSRDTLINKKGRFAYVICTSFSSGRRILGYLLTALAISFGAPFWFDLLNKFVQLRNAGKRPEDVVKKTQISGTAEIKRTEE